MMETDRAILTNLFSKSAAFASISAFFRRPADVDRRWLETVIDEVPINRRAEFRAVRYAINSDRDSYSEILGGTGVCQDGEIGYRPKTPAGAVLADLAGFYRAFGYPFESGTGEKPDHIAVELQFVSFMFAKEAHALASGDTDTADVVSGARVMFLSDHLALWVTAIADSLKQRAAGSGYDLAGELLVELVKSEVPVVEIAGDPVAAVTDAEGTAFACGGCAGEIPVEEEISIEP